MISEKDSDRRIEPRQNDEIAESVKITMDALKDFFGIRGASRQARLRAVGSEFGHIVARNISNSKDPDTVLDEIASFWNSYALGEMEITRGDSTTFTLRNCCDCLGVESGDLMCSFKEGFVNAIINDRTGGIGSVEEFECCTMGHETCRFRVKTLHQEQETAEILPVLG
jgi:predicted hydrocarbon binding protein